MTTSTEASPCIYPPELVANFKAAFPHYLAAHRRLDNNQSLVGYLCELDVKVMAAERVLAGLETLGGINELRQEATLLIERQRIYEEFERLHEEWRQLAGQELDRLHEQWRQQTA